MEHNYLLRNIPKELLTEAKHKAVDEGITFRELIFKSLRCYMEKQKAPQK